MDIEDQVAERPVFVTGADGFVGSHLVDWLVDHGADVHAFVRATSSGELNNIVHRSGEVTVHRGDLRDPHSVQRALSVLEPYDDSLVFHLAAQAHVGESWSRPYDTVDTNVLGTLNLLQAVVDLDLDVAKFDTAGTSEEYGNVKEEMADAHDDDLTAIRFTMHVEADLSDDEFDAIICALTGVIDRGRRLEGERLDSDIAHWRARGRDSLAPATASACASPPIPAAGRRRRLLIADMESTVIQQEMLDELGVERHCCRRMLVSHQDLVDVVSPYQ